MVVIDEKIFLDKITGESKSKHQQIKGLK